MAIKYLSNISLEGNELQNVKIHPVGTAPSNGEGKLYYDTSTNKLMANNGTAWYSVNGDIESLSSGDVTTLTIGGTASAPTVSAVTAAIANGGTGLATADQIHTFVTAQIASSAVAETTTSISLASNILTYTDEDGVDTDINLALYLDDSNLARLTGGSLNGSTGIATFSRDDSSTFTIDMSDFLDAITLNNTLTSTSTTEGLTAAQGKVLKDSIDALVDEDTQLTDAQIAAMGYIKDYTPTQAEITTHQAALSITESQISDLVHITNNNQIGNGAAYISDYTVSEADVTGHQAALSITESQISDLNHFSGAYSALSGLPTLAPSSAEQNVQSNWSATSGDAFILNKPSLFDGAYGSLSGLPTIPTNNNQLTNGNAYISDYTVSQADVTGHQGALSITESQISDLSHFDNNYNSLDNLPSIPTLNNASTTVSGIIELATVTETNTGTATNRAVTPASLQGSLQDRNQAHHKVVTIGDASATTITATHNFGDMAAQVQIIEVSTGETVYADVARSANSVDISFAAAPALNSYKVIMTQMVY